MKTAEIEERLAFVGMGESDWRRLRALRPWLERHLDRVVVPFYRHLLSFEATRSRLARPGVKERLLERQRAYLLSLTRGRVDERYVEERLRIGQVHERIGLEPHWYLGAYAVQLALVASIVQDAWRDEPERALRTLLALAKLLLFDAQLALEAYIVRRETELDDLNRELAEAGRELAREIEEQSEKLQQTVRRARAAEELASVATLVAGLAHEIGTPMGVIRGHAEALESAVKGERARWRLHTIREQIDRISRIIETLLHIARPREAQKKPIDVGEVLEETLVFVSDRLKRNGIELRRCIVPTPRVRGDAEKLQQLFLNLLLNAVDAMPEGGELEVDVGPADGAGVEIRIRDTGHGIPRDALRHIFEPFYTTKPPGQGSGLGLVVARGIVLDHGGEIDVSSQVGSGTEFRIVLPALEDQDARSAGRDPGS